MSILDAIGNTPLVELRRLPPPGAARVLVKLEYANPTGSMKDRMALAAINAGSPSGWGAKPRWSRSSTPG